MTEKKRFNTTRALRLGTHKRCTRCGKVRPLADFPPGQLERYNVYLKCRECIAYYTEERRKKRDEERQKELESAQLSASAIDNEYRRNAFSSFLKANNPKLYKKLYAKDPASI